MWEFLKINITRFPHREPLQFPCTPEHFSMTCPYMYIVHTAAWIPEIAAAWPTNEDDLACRRWCSAGIDTAHVCATGGGWNAGRHIDPATGEV